MDPRRVILTYGWNRVSYAALRCLSKYGVEVIVGGPPGPMMAASSKFAKASFRYPSPYTDPEAFVTRVGEAALEYGAGVYLPMHEEILAAAKYRSLFPSDLIVPISTYDQILTGYDKGLTMQEARMAGVSIPETYFVEDLNDLDTILSDVSFPAWIKLRKSNSAKGVFKVNGRDEAFKKYHWVVANFGIKSDSYPIIQKHESGRLYTVSALCDRGRMLSRFVRKNLREKSHFGGTCTKCESVKNSVLANQAERLLKHLEWHGVALLEYKFNEETGRGYLIEINPRYHGTTDHDIQSGVPTPYLQYLMARGEAFEPVMDYNEGFVSRWLLGDMIGFLDHMRHADSMNQRLRYLKSILQFDEDSYMDLKRDDLSPFLTECWFYLSKFLKTGSQNPIDEGMVG